MRGLGRAQCCLVALLVLGHSAVAQQELFTKIGVVFPSKPEGDIYSGIPLPQDAGVNITLTYKPCSDSEGTSCDGVGIGDAPTLLCGLMSEDRFRDGLLIDRVNGPQEIQLSPNVTKLYADSTVLGSFTCTVQLPSSPLPTVAYPVAYELKVTSIDVPIVLSEEEQAAAAALFDACCQAEGSCNSWRMSTQAAGMNPDDGKAYTNLCDDSFMVCSAEGNLITLYLEGYEMSCDATQLDWSAFSQLQYLYLEGNKLTGDAEAALSNMAGSLPNLKELDVSLNPDLKGDLGGKSTSALCQMVTAEGGGLEVLYLGMSGVTGSLPACVFESSSSLIALFGSRSALDGPLPSSLGASSPIQILQLAAINVGGPLPSSLGPALRKLNFTDSKLTGAVPDFSACTRLTVLDLSDNALEGAVDDSLADHPTLTWLDLRANQLTALPEPWTTADAASSSPLVNLYLGSNPYEPAAFPSGLASLPSLVMLSINNASLTGPLPDPADGQFAALRVLFAASNQLDGAIPEGWANTGIFKEDSTFKGYRVFALPNNSFSGDLPAFLGEAGSDVLMDLSGNVFGNECEPQFARTNACDPGDAGFEDAPSPEEEQQQQEEEEAQLEEDMDGMDMKDDYDYDGEEGADEEGGADEGTDGTVDGQETPEGDQGGDSGLSTGAIVGIAAVVLAAAGGGGFFLYRRRKEQARFERFQDEAALEMAPTAGPPHQYGPPPHQYNTQLNP